MKNLLVILVTLILSSNSCEDPIGVEKVYTIKIKNNSSQLVYYYDNHKYPDTSISINKPYLGGARANDYSYLESDDKWEDVFKKLPLDTLSIFILSKDTVDMYSWDKIRSDYNILKRYDLSIEDLENQDWTITYP